MKKLLLALAFSLAGATAYACDCQKNQQAKTACTCGANQSCPGECNHADPPRTEKKKQQKKS
jgi:hypothetical protein